MTCLVNPQPTQTRLLFCSSKPLSGRGFGDLNCKWRGERLAKWLVNLQDAGALLDAPFTIPYREIFTWSIPITIRLKTTATSRSLAQNAGRLSLRAPVKALVHWFCRWITSLKETSQTIVVMKATCDNFSPFLTPWFAQISSGGSQRSVSEERSPGDYTPERRQGVIDAPKQLAIPRVVASPLF